MYCTTNPISEDFCLAAFAKSDALSARAQKIDIIISGDSQHHFMAASSIEAFKEKAAPEQSKFLDAMETLLGYTPGDEVPAP